ncbi:MAG TPA: glycosyltransferase family 9 protein [Cytophagales bacterium]|nr:glycosyltransferase family 9 protein [Cytophagales bacterium]
MLKQSDWNNFKNILCIRLDNLGDVIMTSPAIRALKNSIPGRKVTLLASRGGNGIAKFIPEIDELLIFDTPWEKNANQGSTEGIFQIVEELKKHQFDAAIIFTVYSQNPLPTAMLCYMSGIPRVAGYCRENPYQLITDWIPETEPIYEIKHEVVRQLDLVKKLGAIVETEEFSLELPDLDNCRITNKLALLRVDTKKPFIVMHPGVSELKRQYPVELFAKAAKMISEEMGYQILLTGLESEKSLTEYIAEEVGSLAYSLAGQLSLEEMMALLKVSPLLISNNTGPVHMAAAMKTPVVVLYALTNPQHTPWKVKHKVLPFDVPKDLRSKNVIISFAYEKCFVNPQEMVTPEEVVKATKELLEEELSPLTTGEPGGYTIEKYF